MPRHQCHQTTKGEPVTEISRRNQHCHQCHPWSPVGMDMCTRARAGAALFRPIGDTDDTGDTGDAVALPGRRVSSSAAEQRCSQPSRVRRDHGQGMGGFSPLAPCPATTVILIRGKFFLAGVPREFKRKSSYFKFFKRPRAARDDGGFRSGPGRRRPASGPAIDADNCQRAKRFQEVPR